MKKILFGFMGLLLIGCPRSGTNQVGDTMPMPGPGQDWPPVIIPVGAPVNATMFEVNGEPEKYVGKAVFFEKAVWAAPIIGRGGLHELQVVNEKDAKPNGLTFSVSKRLTNKLAEQGRTLENQPIHLTCKIEKIGNNWHARVYQVDLVGADGKAISTFNE
jgi:hypothetical protein